ncbi:hypothetical protein ACTWP6_27035 [Mycobacterium sp. 4D054]|uniref:hypothetical protein n=1 Tax=unclassified Mycobacterium TaxID=2642494 RepID=UPI0021B29560|nr:hypothetical protein [Mycobacterium sp. SMC-8]UXA11633.1 hypothetical protein KXD97_27210 [Mycobacterium sp. SMC-8]
MDMKKITAGAATAGMLGLGGLGLGAGIALADPPNPNPGHSGNGPGHNKGPGHGNPNPVPDFTGPGVNFGGPGNPLPPGLGFLPPPGHGGPMPQDRIFLPEIPAWVVNPVLPPVGTPPPPELPDWADGLTIVWNSDLSAWGVWDGEQSVFIRL